MSVTEQQSQQLKGIQNRLRRLNRAALARLRRMRPSLSDKQCREVGKWLGMAATQMNFMVGYREQIIEALAEQKRLFILNVEFVCNCPKDKQVAEPDQSQPVEEQPGLPEALKCTPLWQEEIDRVLELAHCIEQRALERGLSRGTLSETFLSGLHCLVRALLRQKRHLLEPIPESSNFEFKLNLGDGPECNECNPAMESQQL